MAAPDHTALLLVDIQNDFCTGGALPVPDSEAIIPVVNAAIADAQDKGWPIVASRDWHPVDHCSFHHRGGPWPVHCVQDTDGAAFHDELDLPATAVRVSKGSAFEQDAYSAFDGTQLEQYLTRHGIERLQVAGLALDVCVRATVLDALRLGFAVELLASGTRAVVADGTEDVFAELAEAGAGVVH
ncbi:isochorismatase family protein [Marinobacter bohaiensis]|uniref:isochorismatase family protein n=1 Tax=Marinobacter bohaiensis TaxID=2201898 RepID=UPI000DAD7D0E|nr:isochorismatase family protein [Marinobacter bohaiensis]